MILLSVYFSKETPFAFVLGTPCSGKSDAFMNNFTHTHTSAHTRVRARFPTAMLFFCCHKCHTRSKFGWKNLLFLDNEEEKQSLFRGLILCMFGTWITNLLKHIQINIVSNWNTAGYHIPCDTCDSKNAKTLDRSVRVRARERVIIGIFTIPMFPFLFLFQSEGFLGFYPFIENDTSVSIKRHVVSNKTTRRFQQNNTSVSTKQHVVSNKTTRCFRQNKPLVERKRHALSDNTLFGQCPINGREQKKQQKTKYPWFDKLELSKSRVRKIFCCFSAFFSRFSPISTPISMRGMKWGEENVTTKSTEKP